MDLLAEAVPRSDDLVKRITGPMLARTRRLRLGVSLIVLAPGLAVGVLLASLSTPPDSPTGMFFLVLFYAGLLPAGAVYYFFSSQIKIAPKLVRHGVTFSGRIVSFLDGGGKKYFTIEWSADGNARRTKVQATNVSRPMHEGDAVIVLDSPDVKRQVGVILGDNGLYIGDRK